MHRAVIGRKRICVGPEPAESVTEGEFTEEGLEITAGDDISADDRGRAQF